MSRLDQELVGRGLARSRTHAASLIADGRVLLDGVTAVKAAKSTTSDTVLVVLGAETEEYVSRAGHKLAGALDVFTEVLVVSRRCLDAGASTGGFTDVLLRRGADVVEAVDVGHDQMVAQLRADPRVHVHEGVNVRYLEPESIGGQVDLVVADLSFISLTKVIGPLAAATRPGGELVLMIKPQFEVGRDNLARTGVVTSPIMRRRAVELVLKGAFGAGLETRGLARSPLPGQDGNVEFFLWLRRPLETESFYPDARAATDAASWVDYS
ncbi:TlyA family RNA methyltransferase [Paeniglutamicibacter cryotolerans]|uniref:23S rRNA (Cytidine1920-2'-O)/16S rRNA (Cytidine1409-2'-O)-methyltransferase n=1 Tax=Paeniglutamicibacter cryotolerans TaxID=670079 RepID=A0A839QW85_9MICC|nr:TlyA family RNA methyltransferase [Paeniglutamicibacter cryotolerans]MBB2996271.1 23S rRNA (cytidine1920-2'-O)/16S rRNA (cytidine1409-2'-O)-methyltransferase [Paeniglutamicibacter cryotolerans]